METAQMLSKGTTLRGGDLIIDRQLSSGGFGNTYVVRNRLDKVFAMKEFFIKGINLRVDGNATVSVPDNKTTFESQRAKFEKEAKRLSKIDNPHIVKVHDLFYENGTVYYTMDYIDGESLKERMAHTNKPFSEDEVMHILLQLLDALSCVHGQHPPLLHLDIKPGNIMVDKLGNVFLIDFGSSKQIDSEGNETFSTSTGFTYTQGYAPVELMMGVKENIGPWTDFYGLGATLYNLLTNRSPKEVNVHKGESGFDFPVTVSTRMRQLIMWLMNPDCEKRPQSANVIMDWLNKKPQKQQEKKQDDEKTVIDPVVAKPEESIKNSSDSKERKKLFTINPQLFYGLLTLCVVIVLGVVISNSIWRDSSASPVENQDSLAIYDRISPSTSNDKDSLQEKNELPVTIQNLINNMVYVEGGMFVMGATSEQGNDADDDEKPLHKVTLPSFSIGKYEVTQEEWKEVMGENPSKYKNPKSPVEQISWKDCLTFLQKLNAITGKNFRLPTEAEWEYAARGGNQSKNTYKFAGSNTVGGIAWYNENSDNKTHEVGLRQPNELDLYDMSGNVWEWCQDWYGKYDTGNQVNPTGPNSGTMRVSRGGSYSFQARLCRVSLRNYFKPDFRSDDLGLRLVLQ